MRAVEEDAISTICVLIRDDRRMEHVSDRVHDWRSCLRQCHDGFLQTELEACCLTASGLDLGVWGEWEGLGSMSRLMREGHESVHASKRRAALIWPRRSVQLLMARRLPSSAGISTKRAETRPRIDRRNLTTSGVCSPTLSAHRPPRPQRRQRELPLEMPPVRH